MPVLNVIGVPSSAGSYSVGQEQAPRALREAGLLATLSASGYDVHDAGDLPMQAWAPDREHRLAQNLGQVVASLRALAASVAALRSAEDRLLVIGGNCTITLGVVAGLREVGGAPGPGLVYVDRHFDLNTPASTTDGTLDWMGVAHALALPDAADELVDAFGERPLLTPDRLSYLGVDPQSSTEWERDQVARLRLPIVTQAELVAGPAIAARRAAAALPDGPIAVHVDVDVLDFIDAPIAENVNGRNSGPTLDQLGEAIAELWRHPSCRALSVGEINPAHADADPGALSRFVETLGRALMPG
ncbi:arginase [Agromyces sp. CFH 90414]|uniref:Arginase n=1 Tax=Agromyces agglutinans TaxID=2662258 RepID=A0A6I2FDH2_9MICO|nr:arginase family protein [Agromyces agglutinans]MRG60730.1 arginase [Agromyces agglutinans]